jgi:predicted nucleotidyltransferase
MIHPNLNISPQTIAAFCQRNGIAELSLFGSALRPDFRPDSDVDILVEFQPEIRVGFMAFSRMQRELSELLQRRVDLVSKKGLKPVLARQVLQQRQLLYAA